MKKLFRAVSVLLILALAAGPVMAATCATSCGLAALKIVVPEMAASASATMESSTQSADSVESTMPSTAMGMDHCQQMHPAQQSRHIESKDSPSQDLESHYSQLKHSESQSDQHTQQGEHKNCNMAGCHFAQLMPYLSTGHHVLVDNSSATLFRSNVIGVSAEQSPPIKPPA